MQRIATVPREDWRRRAEELGFAFHTIGGQPYWDETACWRLTAAEVDTLEEATGTLEQLCLAAVDRIVAENLFDRLGVDEYAAKLAADSWRRQDRNLYGRFDLAYDGSGPPKLLEYNADTPTALFEAAVVQWEWLQTVRPEADQFNSIHERLIDAWQRFGLKAPVVHFTCLADHEEDRGTTEYLRDTAVQAGLDTHFLGIDAIGWDGKRFIDDRDRPIEVLFKLYPWEWLLADAFGQHIAAADLKMIEPAWKMLLSNKAILVLLWEMYPGHPNLLPAAFRAEDIEGPHVRKPRLGREGANVTVHGVGAEIATPGAYGEEGFVFQALAPLARDGEHHAVIGSWVVASAAAGIGIREDTGPITKDTSRFVPHFFA